MNITLNTREQFLKENHPQLDKQRKKLTTYKNKEEIFKVLSEKQYSTDFIIKKKETYHGIEKTRRYLNIDFYIALQKIKKIKEVSKMHYTTHDKIIEIVKEIIALKEALNTQRPQILQEYPLIRDEKGQWQFDFFWDWGMQEENTPPSTPTRSLSPDSRLSTIRTINEQDWIIDNKNEVQPSSRIDDYYDN